jgi:ArsR family transcriptional regulator
MGSVKSPDAKTLNIFREAIPLLQVLADATRQDIILALAENESLNVNQLAERLPLSRPAISHHLKSLKQTGLIDMEQRGTGNYYFLTLKESVNMLKELLSSIEKNCNIK